MAVYLKLCALMTGKYTIIGVVIDGMDVLDKMEKIKAGKLKPQNAIADPLPIASLLHQPWTLLGVCVCKQRAAATPCGFLPCALLVSRCAN